MRNSVLQVLEPLSKYPVGRLLQAGKMRPADVFLAIRNFEALHSCQFNLANCQAHSSLFV
jgi:hypothetical protein